ncbi:unnamed protein product [Paramecium pentaurelia]|uniref:Uncharacterized protein n=1 Tax=Paramecium pentaurelia TaxID=43138 RepID=A0A8S1XT50_9CILI|nr:unnamed protein product [Paramecium pentaurelia]
MKLVSKNQRPETRIYTLGIWNYFSEYLVQILPEVGNGKYQLVGDSEDINSKVIDLLEDSLTYYLKAFHQQIILTRKIKNQLYKFYFKITQKGKSRIQDCFDLQINKFHMKLKQILKVLMRKNISINQLQTKQMDTVMINQKTLKDLDIIEQSLQIEIPCSKRAFICEVCQNDKIVYSLSKKANNEQKTRGNCQHSCQQLTIQQIFQIYSVKLKSSLFIKSDYDLKKFNSTNYFFLKQQYILNHILSQLKQSFVYIQQQQWRIRKKLLEISTNDQIIYNSVEKLILNQLDSKLHYNNILKYDPNSNKNLNFFVSFTTAILHFICSMIKMLSITRVNKINEEIELTEVSKAKFPQQLYQNIQRIIRFIRNLKKVLNFHL